MFAHLHHVFVSQGTLLDKSPYFFTVDNRHGRCAESHVNGVVEFYRLPRRLYGYNKHTLGRLLVHGNVDKGGRSGAEVRAHAQGKVVEQLVHAFEQVGRIWQTQSFEILVESALKVLVVHTYVEFAAGGVHKAGNYMHDFVMLFAQCLFGTALNSVVGAEHQRTLELGVLRLAAIVFQAYALVVDFQ